MGFFLARIRLLCNVHLKVPEPNESSKEISITGEFEATKNSAFIMTVSQ